MSINVNTFNAPVAAMLDTVAFNALFAQPAFDLSKIRAPAMVARGDQWTGKHFWSMSGHFSSKAEKQPLVGLGLGWPVGQTFTSFVQEMETLTLDPHSLDFLITPPLRSSTWTRTISALNPKATVFVPGPSLSKSKIPTLNPKATAFTPRHTRKSLNPTAVEFVPSSTAFGLNPRATEFIPCAARLSALSQVTPRRTRFPRAPRMAAPCVSEESWDCAEFMDTLASFDSFEEFETYSQSDELTFKLDAGAEEFVPGWINTSIEAAPREPARSTAMRRRTTKRRVRGTLHPQVSEETWDSVEFMDSLEPYDSYGEAVARIQPDDQTSHLGPLASELASRSIPHSETIPGYALRPVPMSRSFAKLKFRIPDPPCKLKITKDRGTGSLRSPVTTRDSSDNERQDGEWIHYRTGICPTGCDTPLLPGPFDPHRPRSQESEPAVGWSIQSEVAIIAPPHQDTNSNLGLWIGLLIGLFAMTCVARGLGGY